MPEPLGLAALIASAGAISLGAIKVLPGAVQGMRALVNGRGSGNGSLKYVEKVLDDHSEHLQAIRTSSDRQTILLEQVVSLLNRQGM